MADSAYAQRQAQGLRQHLGERVRPLLRELDAALDKRLVATFFHTLQAIVVHRHPRCGLLLSELGGYLLDPEHAPAGTKRISNLLRSQKWSATLIAAFLWRQADQAVADLENEGQLPLAIWDESVLEKPESLALEGLCPVRSSHAARLKRIKPGFYTPPSGSPVFVPGMEWLSLLVVGLRGVPVLATMHWWTSRGKGASDRASQRRRLLVACAGAWAKRVVHIFDRGFASSPWLGQVLGHELVFILRWKTNQHLVDAKGKRPAWHITRGQRSLEHRLIHDARRRCERKTGIVFVPVTHPDYPTQPLTLVVSRPGKGRTPWYLLTNLPIASVDDAWRVVLAYARRWQIEITYRSCKSELAMESPRLWQWDNRLKLLAMVTLVYAFLLSLLAPAFAALRGWLLRHFCHRTGKRHRDTPMPLYRLRFALSQLWLRYPHPIPLPLAQTPG
jgi:hypothetical protein